MLTPDEIKRGRELFESVQNTQTLNNWERWNYWKQDNGLTLLTIAEEHQESIQLTAMLWADYDHLVLTHQKLKVSHAADVEAAYDEGRLHAFENDHLSNLPCWNNSDAKKKLQS